MSYNSYNRGPRHHMATKRYSPRPNTAKRRGQFIDPSRFIKKANPAESSNYVAQHSFNDFAIHPLIKSNIAIMGYLKPSEIQDKSIPLGLTGHDIVGVANTGTGKTAAFAVPILNKLMHDRTTQALIITPTRELALQIAEQCKLLARNSGLSDALLIGGLPLARQVTALKNHANIIIGTPGRIKDHLRQGTLNLGDCSMTVLDEVDRMLDMGFIKDVRSILDLLPAQRQSFFFSATVGGEVRTLIQSFTKDPLVINVKAGETSDNVHQDIVKYSSKPERIDKLHDILISEPVKKTLIFGETKYGVERLSRELKTRGFKADALHGNKTQGQRRRALDSFRNNGIDILVATDVAARGIDVVDITHVINFDVPHTYNDYIHRVGRAGRANNTGYALTFIETSLPVTTSNPWRIAKAPL